MRSPFAIGRLVASALTLVLLAGSEPARAQSQELTLGSSMPLADLARQSAGGGQSTLGTASGSQGTVVVFWSNECPWVSKYEDRLLTLARQYSGQGIGFVLINSNDPVAFPNESAAESQRLAQQSGYTMPYLVDADGQLARAFGATRTPHVYVFNGNGTLVYVGTIDDSPGDPNNVQVHYLKDALDAVAAGLDVRMPRTKAFGCTVKTGGAR